MNFMSLTENEVQVPKYLLNKSTASGSSKFPAKINFAFDKVKVLLKKSFTSLLVIVFTLSKKPISGKP